MARGTLRIYLGAAPGVGKTFAMLGEGRRRAQRGTDVVVGVVETHGRARTLEMIGHLEVVPRARIEYRGTAFEEMDVDAVIARNPAVALVDEYAHTNVPGSRNEKRWQDVENLLDAGITVISTLNIQHLESLNDVVEQITGVKQQETVPDEVVRRADQIEIVDMAPEAIRRRMAHGNIYPAERVDAALGNYFRVGNLGALRELALLWVADRVDEALREYRERHHIDQPWETRERVLVALTGAPDGERLVRRAARIAARSKADLMGVHVQPQDGLAGDAARFLGAQRVLLEQLDGGYREIVGGDIGKALVAAARSLNATQIVLGATRRSRWAELTRGSVINRVIRDSGVGIDVHVISQAETDAERPPVSRSRNVPALPRRRQALGLLVAAIALPLLTVVLTQLRDYLGLPSVLLLYLLLVVGVAALGGLWPALAAAVAGSALANWFFTPPLHTFTIEEWENLLALVVFLSVAWIVSGFVALAARRAALATSVRAEVDVLEHLAGAHSVPSLLETLRRAVGLDGVTVLHRNGTSWEVDSAVGSAEASAPSDGTAIDLDERHVLVLSGPPVASDDQRIVAAFAREIAAALDLEELSAGARQAASFAAATELRTAILSAVSHDLRTPLAGIKASVTSLLQDDIEWTADARHEFLETIDQESDRLNALVGNLLDMSRLQTGALEVERVPVGLEEVVPAALTSLAGELDQVVVDVPESLPRVAADPGLLERALANVIGNALRASAGNGTPVRIDACLVGNTVDVRVVDRGRGIPADERDRIFQPFQRLGDASAGEGVGLGLAVAKGFVEAMGGAIEVEDTPGGGLTMILQLPVYS